MASIDHCRRWTATRWAVPLSRTTCRRADLRPVGDHHRSWSGQGPAQADTAREREPSTRVSGVALTSPRPVTITGSPISSRSSTSRGCSCTTDGAGSGTAGGDGIGNQQLYIYTNSNSSTQVGGSIILPIFTSQKFFCNAIYTVGTINLYHVGYQYLGIV